MAAPLFLSALLLFSSTRSSCAKSFLDDFYFSWETGLPEILKDDVIMLKLTRRSGSGFSSRQPFIYGFYSAAIKVPPGFSAGIVTAFYLSSEWDPKWTAEARDGHDEIDFEFLGNTTSGGVSLQTNWYADGVGDHEERLNLWFDPSEDFHLYSITWNRERIVWFVDDIPIRVLEQENPSGMYPKLPMFLQGSLWDASSWATQGGNVKAKWEYEPYHALFRNVSHYGCYWRSLDTSPPFCALSNFTGLWDIVPMPKEEILINFSNRHYRYYDWISDPWRTKDGVGYAPHMRKKNKFRANNAQKTNSA